MKIEKISAKQKQILKFPFSTDYYALICDGAVRSGKTVFMTISFIFWAMKSFSGEKFGICGKTVQSTERNIISILNEIDIISGCFELNYLHSKHILTISGFGHTNEFYVFGGKDESSYMLIQGMTLMGALFDEVALQPQSFVEQAIARTITNKKSSRLFFNCNPEHPEHWFYKNWILDADGENLKNSLHLHFLMEDNPILTKEDIEEVSILWSGIFKRRYIFGEWVVAEGLVYPNYDNTVDFIEMYDKLNDKYFITDEENKKFYGKYYISIDYGTSNPFSAGLWFLTKTFAVRVKEYYWNSRERQKQKTDEEYLKDLKSLIGRRPIESIVVDPSAASFISLLNKNGFNTIKAENNVVDGIRVTDCFLNNKAILINSKCKDSIREFSLYRWDEKVLGEDKVLKKYDHAMDDIRYFCNTILKYRSPFDGYAELIIDNKDIENIWS